MYVLSRYNPITIPNDIFLSVYAGLLQGLVVSRNGQTKHPRTSSAGPSFDEFVRSMLGLRSTGGCIFIANSKIRHASDGYSCCNYTQFQCNSFAYHYVFRDSCTYHHPTSCSSSSIIRGTSHEYDASVCKSNRCASRVSSEDYKHTYNYQDGFSFDARNFRSRDS